MLVGELIDRLSEFPQDAEVWFATGPADCEQFGGVMSVYRDPDPMHDNVVWIDIGDKDPPNG